MVQWRGIVLLLAAQSVLFWRSIVAWVPQLPRGTNGQSSRPPRLLSQILVKRNHNKQQRLGRTTTTSTTTSTQRFDGMLPWFDATPLVVVGVALGLGIAAQGFINQMLEGDQGLGAFLKDGSGYNKSGFRTKNKPKSSSNDPLPWLKLPQLDFVEVAGQPSRQSEQALMEKLESLRLEMNDLLEQGKTENAKIIRAELEALMDEAGIEYSPGQ